MPVRTYLTQADRERNVAAAAVATAAVNASKEDGTYMEGTYGTKADRVGPVWTDSVNGVSVATDAPAAKSVPCKTEVRLAMAFAARVSSVRPAVPFSRETHRPASAWSAYYANRTAAAARRAA